MSIQVFTQMLAVFCCGYPFIICFHWITGALLFHFLRERREPRADQPPPLPAYPPVSVLVPCFNEQALIEETFAALAHIDYPEFEIIAIDDGSSDGTVAALDRLLERMPRLRVVHLASNQGKSTALNVGALAARHEILVCIDGDALLDQHALTWFVRRFQCDTWLGALTGNPRIRNRSSLLGRMQVGEFSSIAGLIKRAQTTYNSMFTVSGVVCAFRKQALHDAGWWDRGSITDDVDVSWRIQFARWRIAYEPKALCWILMPETLRGLWRQRLRWSVGGTRTALDARTRLFRRGGPNLWVVWINFLLATAWAHIVLALVIWEGLALPGWLPPPDFSLVPAGWGLLMLVAYLFQATVGIALDSRVEKGMLSALFWIPWYPAAFWILQASTAIAALPMALARPRSAAGTWVSPDRGFR